MEDTKEESNRMLVGLIITVILFILCGLYFSECEKRIEKEKKIQNQIEAKITGNNINPITNNYIFNT